mmetsp:Transcript_27986/g.56368  ORF Transcript_27986/g.56368 Transcript_27986/m.56368 type:complete len:276 (-) Transcript_27986:42-869(-)
MSSEFSTMTASESDGVTKNLRPRIMLRSASPSAAAPNTGGSTSWPVMGRPSLETPMMSQSSRAFARFGSACPCEGDVGPPKSSLGSQLMREEGGAPRMSQNTFLAYGPWTPESESYLKVKSGRAKSFLIGSKSKHPASTLTWSSVGSNTSICTVLEPSAEVILVVPMVEMSISGKSSAEMISEIVLVFSKMSSVTFSGAGPPFSQLYLIPKSSSMPPGLCEADRMKAPNALKPPSRARITAEAAGVDSRPSLPIQILLTPAATAILAMIWIASLL